MDDILVGYLLNSLDVEERRAVEERLRREPDLGDRLTALKKTLATLALDTDVPEPPPRLVLATLARVAEQHCRRPAPPRPVLSLDGAPARRWFRRADVLAAALMLILVGALGFPWLVRQWQQYQIRACQRNLVVFWHGLQFHSDTLNHGAFPRLEEEGPCSFAGIVVPILNDEKLLGPDASILCPAVGRRGPDERSVRDLKLLYERRGPDEYRLVLRDVGGSYAYPLGYRQGQRLIGLHRDVNDGQPIMADAPSTSNCHANSDNHGCRGQNVLFVGGEVRWYTVRNVGPDGDDIFLNQNNEVAAGLSRDDIVLGAGDACPVPSQRR